MTTPLCKYYGECGGCSLQHIDYSTQLENKKKSLATAIGFTDIKIFSGSEYHYRNRMDAVFHPNGLGFRRKGTWDKVMEIESCAICNERLNELFMEVGNFFTSVDSFDLRKHTGTFRYAIIRTPSEDSSVSFVLNNGSPRVAEAIYRIKEFAKKTTAQNIIATYVEPQKDASLSEDYFAVKGADMLREKYLGKEFIYSVQGFFQNNHKMAEAMQEYVNTLLGSYETKNAHLLDLYGGVGTFGIINAPLFKGATILENVPQCIEAAKVNIEKNGARNAEAILLDATHLKRLDLPSSLFVITDPPRSGMHPKTIEQLNRLRPKAIVYISCNAEQLGRDLPKFKEYELKSAALFDLFPQTPHIEAVTELVLRH